MKKTLTIAVASTILALAVACGGDSSPSGDFPENPGYLHATSADFGKLVNPVCEFYTKDRNS